MGMAPQGKFNKNLYQRLKMFADFDSVHASLFLQYVELLKKEGWFTEEQKRKDFAFTWQRLSEDVIIELIAHIKQKYPGHKKLVLAGGFFANVKANQKINEYLDFEEIYIMPAMSDDGLSIGAALLRSQELMPIENKRWDNVFLGKGYTNDEIFPLIKDLNFKLNL
jgi:carbamoyltransferase